MCHPDGDVGGDGDHPGEGDQDLGVGDGADGEGGDGEDDSKESVSSHEYEGVDGDIGAHVDDVLDAPAPEEAEGPVHEDVVTGGERDAHEDEEQIRNCQVEDEQVGGVLHLGVEINLGK